ncbi:MAG TPA: T9SS type A sorting domain-containing protein [Ignavibacteria bacterium]|nr:T9SS type A sorting domain-containing protein [Ignavibacteria bacterium]
MLKTDVYSHDQCGTTVLPQVLEAQPLVGGYLKPERTDLSNGVPIPPEIQDQAYFNVLFVFIQFANEVGASFEWPVGQPPNYMNTLLAIDKNPMGNFWDRYNSQTQLLSDYYQEVSQGKLHLTGITKHIVMPFSHSYYEQLGPNRYDLLLTDIYNILKNDLSINWIDLDKWSFNSSNQKFQLEPDDYIDMMGLFFRTNTFFSGNAAGYVPLGGPSDFEIHPDPTINKYIGAERDYQGSGFFSIGNQGPLPKNRALGIAIHEIGHYLFAHNHSESGIMTSRGGISINDFFYSGFERFKLGYAPATTVDFSGNVNQLNDASGRDGIENIFLKVPISSTEFFLIENRRKISKYDHYMLGDQCNLNPLNYTGDLGKGVYIYHSMDNMNYTSNVDLECADGIYNWIQDGTAIPDWNFGATLPLVKRYELPLVIQNDNSYWQLSNQYKDGVSAHAFRQDIGGIGAYFSLGKRNTIQGQIGDDKLFTNYPDWWTSRELWGDRWDAWNLGYNEIFSPYSNPNTKNKDNLNTGIFIHYTGLNGNDASFKFYKAGVGGYTEDEVLQLTPPSKPQILEIESHWNGRNCNPKIVWRQNMEPDMVRTTEIHEQTYKRYKIYKSGNLNGMNSLPPDQMFYPEQVYQYVTTVDFNPYETDAYWIDPNVNLYDCSEVGETPGIPYPVRYRVQAVDKYNTSSVLSDFRSAVGVKDGSGEPIGDPEENPILNTGTNQTEIPEKYLLKQNYPNPFNPVTNIQYDLPVGKFVVLKIYDINGREVKTLVNEFKPAGRYVYSFNAGELSSGIYFYKIEAGEFVVTKKMILLK